MKKSKMRWVAFILLCLLWNLLRSWLGFETTIFLMVFLIYWEVVFENFFSRYV